MVIKIDSAGVTFPETAATGLTIVTASGGISGFSAVTFDLTSFTGNGTWSAYQDGTSIKLDYTAGAAGYSTWASANAGNQSADLDFDLDGVSNGVEYFMGETGSSFTPNPPIVTAGAVRTITWPKDPAFVGTFKVQISDTLALGSWTDIVPPNASIDETNPNQVVYTLPSGSPKKFARLSVTVTP